MEVERKIAESHGYYRGLGDKVSDYYGGIGAFHQLNFFLDLARDVEEICPDAWLLQAANPVFEGTTLISRETKAKVVGVCHGHFSYVDILKAIGLSRKDVDVTVAGFNHNIWLAGFLHNGENAYPLLEQWIDEKAEEYWKSDEYLNGQPWAAEQMSPAAVDMYGLYGLYPIGDTVRSASPWWYHTDLRTKQK
jgi:alpha-galactosidase